jgi:Ca2+-binding RTX toxin-like protein
VSKTFSAGCRRRLALTAVLFGGALALPTVASAATCAFAPAAVPATVTVTLPASETATVGRNLAGNIQVNGANCSTATVTNTDLIKIVGASTFSQIVNLTLANGPLGPGKTAETGAGAVSEIEVQVQLGMGYDKLSFSGGAAVDNFRLGTLGANLNNDNDGNDVVWSGLDDYMDVSGRAGNDALSAEGGAGTGSPLQRNLYMMGGAGADGMTGGAKGDYMWGDSDVVFGAPVATGNDTLFGGDGGDRLYGQNGNDILEGQNGFDSLYLEAGNDQLRGGDGGDYFDNPTFITTADGADLISGGRGQDSLDLGDRPHNVAITLNNTADDGQDTNSPPDRLGNELDNVMADIEYFYLGSGNDFFNANTPQANVAELRQTVDGGTGNDNLQGGEGDDSLSGRGGNDVVAGQAGDDTVRGDEDTDNVSGGDGDDYVYGGVGGDIINGNAGDDYLYQESAADGSDFISGGPGVDHADFSSRSTNTRITQDNVDPAGACRGNDGADVDQNNVAEECDDLRADNEQISTGSGNDLISANFGAANLLGADNVFRGNDNNDVLHGGVGEDSLHGGNGNDNLTGGTGYDELYGDTGADIFAAIDGFFDYLDGGFDSVTDTQTSDPFDEKVRFP